MMWMKPGSTPGWGICNKNRRLPSAIARSCCVLSSILLVGWTSLATAEPMFVCVGTDGQSLVTVELTEPGKAVITNTQTLSPSVSPSTFPDITSDNSTTIYGLQNDGAAIIEANATSGAWSNGSFGPITGGVYDDIAYDVGQGQMYGIANSGTNLYRISGPTSGDQVLVGQFSTGGSPSGAFIGITIDASTGQMYGLGAGGNALYTIDKANAVWSEIGIFSAESGGVQGNFLDLAFSAEGQLYGMNNNGTGIHAIDKATAVYGNTAFVIQTAGGAPTTVSTQFAAVPEPGSYALAIPGLLCGLYSLWRRRT